MDVPIFRLEFDGAYRRRFHAGCERIFDSGQLTGGAFVREFEEAFAALCGTRFAAAVSSGTAALELALRALGVRGKRVLVPTNTFIATAAAVENAGGVVVPLDIEPETFALAPEVLDKQLDEDVAAVVVVHIGGTIAAATLALRDICEARGVPLLEDACHAHGASAFGGHAGSFGAAGCFSFFPTKVATCGEGGMVVTDDPELHAQIRALREFGRSDADKDLHDRLGTNAKLSEFQALAGVLDLERMPARVERRRALAAIYRERLRDSEWEAVEPPAGHRGSHYKQIVLTERDPAAVREACRARGVALTGMVYEHPLHRQPVYRETAARLGLPVADDFCAGHICPPLYPELDEAEVERVCDTLLSLEGAR